MNRTSNYKLCQWEADDKIQRVDFNEDNAKIDGAIKASDTKADGKAEKSALTALAQTVAQERIHVGSFVGNGANPRTIQLPWAPTFAVLFGTLNEHISPFFLTQGHCEYVGGSSCGIDSSHAPQLSGASLRLNLWANGGGKTTHYILFR